MIYFYVIVKLINILLFRCFILKLKQKFDSCKECKILKELELKLGLWLGMASQNSYQVCDNSLCQRRPMVLINVLCQFKVNIELKIHQKEL